jgi:hypothetical protein
MLMATVFFSSSGSATSKRSDKGCSVSCSAGDGSCVAAHFGRIVAIGLVSTLVAGVPLTILSSLHRRSFVKVDYEGSPDWHKQLRSWRRRDVSIWLVGVAYCMFGGSFAMLFFANVAPKDQVDWILTAAVGLIEDFVIIPVLIGFVTAALALLMVSIISWKNGLHRQQFVEHGSLEDIRAVLKDSQFYGSIQEAFSCQEGVARWVTRQKTLRAEEGVEERHERLEADIRQRDEADLPDIPDEPPCLDPRLGLTSDDEVCI